MEGHAQGKCDTHQLEEIAPHMPYEHRVPISEDGRRELVEANDAVEESTHN